MRLSALPALTDNYIWRLADAEGRWLAVDPGEAAPVLAAAEGAAAPLAILLTHHHDDHVGGIGALRDRWPGVPVYGPADPRLPAPIHRVGDGDLVEAGPWRFRVLSVPGHTVSHIAFHGHDLLFCGDTLFSLGCGRLFEGTPRDMLGSLDRLAALPDATRVCCGHEYTLANAAFARVVDPDNATLRRRHAQATTMRDQGLPTLPTTLGEERDCNPFLRIDASAVRAAVAARLPAAAGDRIEAFAELRRWKDGFRA
ncbi:hydroxyacylglutathione hydrolase [Luteimonas saliphila]|uniref:hydroxyacylglutathione hydrolase n=1 Tax=Luteimonas saliphila TaxID=2804919 RepID=UPI00192D7160|nr:hydroxyacylglutathione hydrolase [Luteimonas saliphila]